MLLFHPRMFKFAHFFKENSAMLLSVSIFAWLVVCWLLHGGEWLARSMAVNDRVGCKFGNGGY